MLGWGNIRAIPDLVRPRPAFGCNAVSCRTGRVRRHWGCHLYFARRVSFLSCADSFCRRPIKMSPLCQFEMTLPGEFRGVFGVTVRRMSDGKLSRIEVLRDVDRKELTSASVVPLLSLSQVFCGGPR